jgi:hypothetical protein
MPAAIKVPAITELRRLLRLWEQGKLTRAAARRVLRMDFTEAEHERAHELAVKNKDGTITPAELKELDAHIRAGLVLSTLQSRARVQLRTAGAGQTGE